MDIQDSFDNSGNNEGLLSHGNGTGEDYDDVYCNGKGSVIHSEYNIYGDRGVEY